MRLPDPPDAHFRYEQAELLQIVPPETPPDFYDFWQKTYRAARQISLNLKKREI